MTNARLVHLEKHNYKIEKSYGGDETHSWEQIEKAAEISISLPHEGPEEEIVACPFCQFEFILIKRSKKSARKFRRLKLLLLFTAWFSLIPLIALPNFFPNSSLKGAGLIFLCLTVPGFVLGNIYGRRAYALKIRNTDDDHGLECKDNPCWTPDRGTGRE